MIVALIAYILVTPGWEAQKDAVDAFSQGRLNLVYIGELAPAGHRDAETGMLLESLGCLWTEEQEVYCDSWNEYMTRQWSLIGSDSTYFVIRTEAESLEYSEGVLTYRDSWGSVPVEIYPEDFAALLETSGYPLRDTIDNICHLEMYTPLQRDTIRTEIPVRSEIVALLLNRGRREIQLNQMVD